MVKYDVMLSLVTFENFLSVVIVTLTAKVGPYPP